MTVTLTPTRCRKDLGYHHQRGPEKDQRVRCGDHYRWSTGTDPNPRTCGLCRQLGDQLADLGGEWCGADIRARWEQCLAWNLTLASLLQTAEELALDEYERTHRIMLPDVVFDAFTANIQDSKPPTEKLVDLFRHDGDRRAPEPVVSSAPIDGELRRREERRDDYRTPAPVRSMMVGLACAQTECRHRGQCTNYSAPCVSERPLHEDDCRCEWCKVHA